MSDETKTPNRISIESIAVEDGAYWIVKVDGVDHGGGTSRSHASAVREAAGYLADRGWVDDAAYLGGTS